jgi:hypothetical protein
MRFTFSVMLSMVRSLRGGTSTWEGSMMGVIESVMRYLRLVTIVVWSEVDLEARQYFTRDDVE